MSLHHVFLLIADISGNMGSPKKPAKRFAWGEGGGNSAFYATGWHHLALFAERLW